MLRSETTVIYLWIIVWEGGVEHCMSFLGRGWGDAYERNGRAGLLHDG